MMNTYFHWASGILSTSDYYSWWPECCNKKLSRCWGSTTCEPMDAIL